MKTLRWWIIPGLALALGILSCAPVDPVPEENSSEAPAVEAGEPIPGVSPETKDAGKAPAEVPNSLKKRLEAAINNIRARDLTIANGFWTVFHGILGLGPGVELIDPKTKERTNALNYICSGGSLRGLVFKPTVLGVDVVSTMDGLGQGHQDQFIAEMAQWSMPYNRPMKVQGKDFTFADFVDFSLNRASVRQKQELSWTIIIVAQYKGLDYEWKTPQHEKLHFNDILRYELDQSIENAACGGTHRLFGMSWVYHMHLARGGKTEGLWKAVAEKTVRYRDLARKMQNPDGTFSTSFFRGPGSERDKNLRINTTGHILEWLALALSDDELREPWVQEAVNALCLQILDLQGASIDGGGMYHAVHGLLIYYARVFDRSFCPPELLVPLPPGWKKV
ncbi:MAG: hypothetical protein U0840_05190 [Gemmataceae bacterium]